MTYGRWLLVSHSKISARPPYIFDRCSTRWGARLSARQLNGTHMQDRAWLDVIDARTVRVLPDGTVVEATSR